MHLGNTAKIFRVMVSNYIYSENGFGVVDSFLKLPEEKTSNGAGTIETAETPDISIFYPYSQESWPFCL